jgi:hypothetical protein
MLRRFPPAPKHEQGNVLFLLPKGFHQFPMALTHVRLGCPGGLGAEAQRTEKLPARFPGAFAAERVVLGQALEQMILRIRAQGAAVVRQAGQLRVLFQDVQKLERRPEALRGPGAGIHHVRRKARLIYASQDLPKAIHRGA